MGSLYFKEKKHADAYVRKSKEWGRVGIVMHSHYKNKKWKTLTAKNQKELDKIVKRSRSR